jgi:hypothetical protein
MAFEFHSDTATHPAVHAAGLAGWGTFILCGTWTSANGETGVVPDAVAAEHASPEDVSALVDAGLWTKIDGGYRMEYGPSTDLPLPLWRYGDSPSNGQLLSFVPDPEA